MRSINTMSLKHYVLVTLCCMGLVCNEAVWAANDDHDGFTNVHASDKLTLSISEAAEEPIVKTYLKTEVKNATVDQIKDLIFDLDTMSSWLGGVKKVNLIEKYSDTKQRGRFINGMPFPLDDRQIVMIQEVTEATPERISIRLTSDYTNLEKTTKYVSVEPYNGEWTLTQVGSNVQVELSDVYNAKIASLPQYLVVAHIKGAANDTIDTLAALTLKSD